LVIVRAVVAELTRTVSHGLAVRVITVHETVSIVVPSVVAALRAADAQIVVAAGTTDNLTIAGQPEEGT
jgi:hypothetical protein